MKKLGPKLILRGRMPARINGHHIPLFDGRFDTGYLIESFAVSPEVATNNNEIMAKVMTTPSTSSISRWYWARTTEVAWAAWMAPSYQSGNTSYVVSDRFLVEDLYMANYYATGDTDDPVNYEITLQKYKIAIWEGVLALVQARPQGTLANAP